MTKQEALRMTPDQAYLAMYHFLDKQFLLGCKEIGDILGSMSLLPDGRPADSALLQDWLDSVNIALSGTVDASLRIEP